MLVIIHHTPMVVPRTPFQLVPRYQKVFKCNFVEIPLTKGLSKEFLYFATKSPVFYNPDIDECSLGLFWCPDHSACVNTRGTYTCLCEEGYIKQKDGSCELLPSEEADEFKLRVCPCVCPQNLTQNIKDVEEIKQTAVTITKKLEVKAINLTNTVRRRTSATDERQSSTSLGIIAVTLLCTTLFLFILGDLLTVVYYLVQAVKNCSKGYSQKSRKEQQSCDT
ncbi:protein kinase c-binding protein nell2 [Plakobranchus ocellatus]|uniref:Protein kinase c-binding protein nell2 n=1 Tax=Plakobranchus ocellatus TaxID=259542 RepID=A0AAV4BUV2_9GAST|nr:protein kinase c-binding protein nell2 [Plakobranchus ocellatus]